MRVFPGRNFLHSSSPGLSELLLKAEFFPGLGDGDGILAGKAAIAEGSGAAAGQLVDAVHTEIAQGVGADEGGDLLGGVVAGDQVVPGVDVGAEVAGVQEGRSGDAHMDLLGSRLPQQPDDPFRGGATDNGVVDHDHPLARYHGSDGI